MDTPDTVLTRYTWVPYTCYLLNSLSICSYLSLLSLLSLEYRCINSVDRLPNEARNLTNPERLNLATL